MPPANGAPAESRIVKNFRSGLIELVSKQKIYTVKAEEGNFNLQIPGRTVEVYTDRGQFVDPDDPTAEPQVQYGQDQPMTWTFTARLRDLGMDKDYLSLTDFVTQSGLFLAEWGELLDGGPDSPLLVTCQWWMRGQRYGDPKNKGYRLPFSHITGTIAEGGPNTITSSGTSYAVYPSPARWEQR